MSVPMRKIDRGEAGYPDLLASIPDSPERLYVRGVLSESPALAIVGSRRPTQYGRRVTSSLARECARAGLVVVSGLARGIDTAAHRAALEAGGITWAVLGSGLDRVYPRENLDLAEEIIARGGAVLGEVPPGGAPHAGHFPKRNRIISGLSWGTVVVEGASRSGALITARAAGDQGRDVFAVPGPVDSPLSEAPHALLKKGACLIRNLDDILEGCLPLALAASQRRAEAGRNPTASGGGISSPYGSVTLPRGSLDKDARKILELLGSETKSLEELISEAELPLPKILQVLTGMETQGIISALAGQRYGRS